jgi:hypothetical protein
MKSKVPKQPAKKTAVAKDSIKPTVNKNSKRIAKPAKESVVKIVLDQQKDKKAKDSKTKDQRNSKSVKKKAEKQEKKEKKERKKSKAQEEIKQKVDNINKELLRLRSCISHTPANSQSLHTQRLDTTLPATKNQVEVMTSVYNANSLGLKSRSARFVAKNNSIMSQKALQSKIPLRQSKTRAGSKQSKLSPRKEETKGFRNEMEGLKKKIRTENGRQSPTFGNAKKSPEKEKHKVDEQILFGTQQSALPVTRSQVIENGAFTQLSKSGPKKMHTPQ